MLEAMIRVGLTGGIGSGKSTVAALLADRGALVIDADRIAREIVEPGQPALTEIEQRFGDDVIAPDGRLDRGALAGIVFADTAALSDLNAITHPRIAQRTADLIEAAPADAAVVYDMPLLVENDLAEGWDLVIVVEADRDVRIRRLIERGLDEADIEARMNRQATDEQRRAVADIVIDNSGDLRMLEQAVDGAWSQIIATKQGE
jgi:dephospho-CoA kinase